MRSVLQAVLHWLLNLRVAMPPGAGAVSLFCFPHGLPDCLVMKLFCTLSPNEWFILCKVEQIERERPRQPDPRLIAWQVNTWQTLAHVLSRWRQRGDPALAQPHLVPEWQLSRYAGRLINLNLVIIAFLFFFPPFPQTELKTLVQC